MRAVIIGTDFMKDIDGSFKAIETNTNIQLGVQFLLNFDSGSFESFVESNNFSKINLITNAGQCVIKVDGAYDYDYESFLVYHSASLNEVSSSFVYKLSLDTYLKNYCTGSGILFEKISTDINAVTIPFIEDNDETLTIRLSYDTTALIDDTYSRDNWEFLKLMYDTDPNSIPKCYINDSELSIDSIGIVLRDNGNHPNYCVKKRVTPSDNKVYPKLYKINSIEELEALKSGLEVDEYIQEFIYNTDDLLDNRAKYYRSMDLLYGSDLDIINLNVVERTSLLEIIDNADFDDDNQVQYWDRLRYVPKYYNQVSDHAAILSADINTRIIYPNNESAVVQNLNVGDIVKSISFDTIDQNESSTGSFLQWSSSIDSVLTQYNVSSSMLKSKDEFEFFGEIVTITTEQGSIFSDVEHAKVMVLDSESNIVKFKTYGKIETNDKLLVLDNSIDTLIVSNITGINYRFEKLTAYTLNFEDLDLFLTLEETPGSSRYGLIVHNFGYDCFYKQCCNSCPSFYNNIYYGQECTSGAGIFVEFGHSGACYGYACVRQPNSDNGSINYCYCAADPIYATTQYTFASCNSQKSDIHYKENLNLIGKSESGINIYQFNYKNEEGLYEGIIAQELIETEFQDALTKGENNLYLVDYDKIDVEFKKIS